VVQALSRWTFVDAPDPARVAALADALSVPPELAALLIQRGIDESGSARAFLRPTLEQLSDPHGFRDLPEAVDLVARHVQRGSTIMVHGDYDVDGQCATAILTRALRAAGAMVIPFVPNRLRDGYDLSEAGVRAAVEGGAALIVTCDCGTTAHEAVARARAAGLDVIVTDHHLPGDLPPANAVINPRRPDCPSVSKDLCGAGVAFKLVQGLVEPLGLPENLPWHFLDLVALATVADLVSLRGENRALVTYGLRALAQSRWPGVRALVEAAGLAGKPLRAGQIGFILAPRLNAVGRIGDAMEGLRLLLADDPAEARPWAEELEAINTRRQDLDRTILDQAIEEVETRVDLSEAYGLVLAREGWHPGVIGIVASRIVERYARPTIMVGLEGGVGKGSGRSIHGFDLHAALRACGDYLVKYGGHPMAAGLTVEADQLDAFRTAFNTVACSCLTPDDLVRRQRIDVVVPVGRLSGPFEKLLRRFEPCGMGNPGPVLAVTGGRVARAREVGKQHLKFTLEDHSGQVSAIGFGLSERVEPEWLKGPVDVAFRLERNEWNGRSTLQARVIDLRPSS